MRPGLAGGTIEDQGQAAGNEGRRVILGITGIGFLQDSGCRIGLEEEITEIRGRRRFRGRESRISPEDVLIRLRGREGKRGTESAEDRLMQRGLIR